MLFWIFVIGLLAGIVLYIASGKCQKFYDYDAVGAVLIITCGIMFFIMLTIIVCNNICYLGEKSAYEQRYESLIYKAKTKTIRDRFGIVNKEYIDEIQDWNEMIAKGKSLQRDFWVGIFVPNIYDGFEVIDLDEINYRE